MSGINTFAAMAIFAVTLFAAISYFFIFKYLKNSINLSPIPINYTSIKRTEDITLDEEQFEPKAVNGWITFAFKGFKVKAAMPESFKIDTVGEYSAIIGPIDQVYSVKPTRFAFITIVPRDIYIQGLAYGNNDIYGYNPAVFNKLENLEIGDKVTIEDGPDRSNQYTIGRSLDNTSGNATSKVFISTDPPDFPEGTNEYLYVFDEQESGDLIIFGAYIGGGGLPDSDINLITIRKMVDKFEPISGIPQ